MPMCLWSFSHKPMCGSYKGICKLMNGGTRLSYKTHVGTFPPYDFPISYPFLHRMVGTSFSGSLAMWWVLVAYLALAYLFAGYCLLRTHWNRKDEGHILEFLGRVLTWAIAPLLLPLIVILILVSPLPPIT